jgi:hypothetical protein
MGPCRSLGGVANYGRALKSPAVMGLPTAEKVQ